MYIGTDEFTDEKHVQTIKQNIFCCSFYFQTVEVCNRQCSAVDAPLRHWRKKKTDLSPSVFRIWVRGRTGIRNKNYSTVNAFSPKKRAPAAGFFLLTSASAEVESEVNSLKRSLIPAACITLA